LKPLKKLWSWLGYEAPLRIAANWWIICDPVEPADAVAILGGDPGPRALAAAQYYRAGLVHKVLISGGHYLISSKPSLARRVLATQLCVPESSIEVFGSVARDTYQEAVALREWALRNNAREVLVPVESFCSRRVRWIFKKQLAKVGARIKVPALDTEEHSSDKWWESEQALRLFRREVIKYIYYRIRY
jgi:uncharacterized SAM-binding protein YcdF (DUF218 family)